MRVYNCDVQRHYTPPKVVAFSKKLECLIKTSLNHIALADTQFITRQRNYIRTTDTIISYIFTCPQHPIIMYIIIANDDDIIASVSPGPWLLVRRCSRQLSPCRSECTAAPWGLPVPQGLAEGEREERTQGNRKELHYLKRERGRGGRRERGSYGRREGGGYHIQGRWGLLMLISLYLLLRQIQCPA